MKSTFNFERSPIIFIATFIYEIISILDVGSFLYLILDRLDEVRKPSSDRNKEYIFKKTIENNVIHDLL